MALFFPGGLFSLISNDPNDNMADAVELLNERLRKIKEKRIRKKRIVRNKTCLICKEFKDYYYHGI